jgi:hypothetical protein
MAFDVQGARKAGYTDAEIADFLGQQSRFDVAGARQAGYSDGEVIDHLASAKPTPKAGLAEDVAKSAIAGVQQNASGIVGMAGDIQHLPGNIAAGAARLAGRVGLVKPDVAEAIARGAHDGADRSFDPANPLGVIAPTSGQVNDARQRVTGKDYEPQTGAGQVARAIGRNALNAALPGGLAARAANVLAPALAGQGARAATKAAGGGETAQDVAETAGSLAGGLAANVRIGATTGSAKPIPKPANLQQLQAAKTAAYQAVDGAGVRYTPQAFSNAVDHIAAQAGADSLNPARHPKAASMLADLKAQAKDVVAGKAEPPTLTQIDQIRQVISRDVARASDAAERFFGKKMIAGLDDMVNNAKPEDLAGADPKTAADLISNARDLNTRFRKVETVTNAVSKAELRAASTGSGGNANNATRQNLRGVLERGQNFTPDERSALTTAVTGTPVQNALRLAGKVSPEGNGLMLAGHLTAGALSHGTSIPVAVAGIAAKAMADGMTRQSVQKVIDLISVGGNAEELQLAQMAARDARIDNLVRQLNRVSLNSSTVNALSGVQSTRAASAGR